MAEYRIKDKALEQLHLCLRCQIGAHLFFGQMLLSKEGIQRNAFLRKLGQERLIKLLCHDLNHLLRDFTLETLSVFIHSRSHLRLRIAILELFFRSCAETIAQLSYRCNPCVGELSDLDALNKELAEKGGSLIGVNTFTLDGDETAISEAKDVLDKKGATYQNVYFDSDGEAGKFTTNIFAYPTTYVVDRNGNIVGEPIVGAITEKKQAETLQKLIEQALAADVG